jgi:hypothetical protein
MPNAKNPPMVRANKGTKPTKGKPYGTSKETNKRPMTGQFREKTLE